MSVHQTVSLPIVTVVGTVVVNNNNLFPYLIIIFPSDLDIHN